MVQIENSKDFDIHTISDLLEVGWWEVDLHKKWMTCSRQLAETLNLPPSTPDIQYYEKIREDYRARIVNSIVTASKEKITQCAFPLYVNDAQLWLTLRFKRADEHRVAGIVYPIERLEEDEKLNKTSQETVRNLIYMLNGISKSLFTFLQSENLDNMVNHILSSLVTHFSAERAYIFEYNWDEMNQSCTYEAVSRPGLEEIQNLEKMFFIPETWWNQQILSRRPIILSTLDDLPEWDDVDREVLEAQNIKSLMVVPFISHDNTVWGYAGIDIVDKQRNWAEEDFQWFSSLMHIINICFELTKMTMAKNKAEELEQLKSAFLANMSHEIRTPLNAIIGFTDLLTETDDEAERFEFIKIIQRNNELLLKLVNDVLDLSKIESGTFRFAKSEINVQTICEEIVQSFGNKKLPEGVELIFSYPKQEQIMLADPNRIKQVLMNFITNSIKFTPKGHIKLGFEPRGADHILFYVEDTGTGIAQEDIERIFDRFVKLDNFAQGTGLGLSICKSLIEEMGGTLKVDSVLGKGSRFWFVLPKWMN